MRADTIGSPGGAADSLHITDPTLQRFQPPNDVLVLLNDLLQVSRYPTGGGAGREGFALHLQIDLYLVLLR